MGVQLIEGSLLTRTHSVHHRFVSDITLGGAEHFVIAKCCLEALITVDVAWVQNTPRV